MLDSHSQYSEASGLSEQSSDWLISLGVSSNSGLSAYSRALIDDTAALTKWETRLDLVRDRYALGASYTYLIKDLTEEREEDLSEIRLDGEVQLTKNWSASAQYLYDFASDVATRARLGVAYQNECAQLKLGVTRRLSDTTSLDPSTNVSFTVGFGAYGQDFTDKKSCGF